MALLALAEAQARLLALVRPLPAQDVAIAEANGRFLAAPLLARRTQPALDLSAMDGYAVGPDDARGPWRIIGESAAGRPFSGTFGPGEAVRISTGAAMPAGSASVIVQEDITRDGETIRLTGDGPAQPDTHVRRRGQDFAEGDGILAAGAFLGPAELALAVAAGHARLSVAARPRVAVLDSGDELVPAGEPCLPHQIPASNAWMLRSMVAGLADVLPSAGSVPDRLDAMVSALEATGGANLVLTSGGASVGDHDLLQPALRAWGAEIDFWKIAIKPGKPLLVATRGDTVILGLPGNPVSSFVTALLFALPVLRAMQGAAAVLPRRVTARVTGALPSCGPRKEFLRAWWDGAAVRPHAMRDSGALASLAASNALIVRPADGPAVAAGDTVVVHPFEFGGIR